jgi:hypothetical protein
MPDHDQDTRDLVLLALICLAAMRTAVKLLAPRAVVELQVRGRLYIPRLR